MSSEVSTGHKRHFKSVLCAGTAVMLALASTSEAFADSYYPDEEPIRVESSGRTSSSPEADPWSSLMVGGTGIALTALAIAFGGAGGGDSGGVSSPDPKDPEDPSLPETPAFAQQYAGTASKQGFAPDIGNLLAASGLNDRTSAMHRMRLFGGAEERSVNSVEAGPFSMTTGLGLRADGGLSPSSYSRMTFKFSGDGYSATGAVNPNMGKEFGLREIGFGRSAVMDSRSFDQPHMALMETGYGGIFGVGLSSDTDIRFAAFSGDLAAEDSFSLQAPSVFGGVGEITTALSDGFTLKASLGAMSEEGSLLGSVSESMFGDDIRSNTVFANLGTSVNLGEATSLTVAGSLGRTSFRHGGGMVRGGDEILTSSFGVGLHHRGLLEERDNLTLALSQPLRVESGAFNISAPGGHRGGGLAGYDRRSLSADPSGREINLQASYGFDLMEGIEASVGAMHRFDANHVRGRNETIGMITTSFRF